MELISKHSCFSDSSQREVLERVLTSDSTETSTNILNLDEIVRNFQRWKETHPRAVPFYSPSINNHPSVLTLLGELGVGFSCASISEMRTALSNGVPAERIRLVHPAKSPETILYAKQKDIRRIVCDSVQEIGKVHRLHPEAGIILRVRVRSGQKFGCCPERDVPEIFNYVQSIGTIDLVGFHICIPQEKPFSLTMLQEAFLILQKVVHMVETLAFSGIREVILSGTEHATPGVLHDTLRQSNLNSSITVIVETGRSLVESAVTLITCVQSKRVIRQAGTSGPIQEIMYFINDGRYGSFEWWDALDKQPILFRNRETHHPDTVYPSSLWGPTCDSADLVCERLDLPELEVGDFLAFPGMGAFGVTLASRFNGFPIPKTVVCAGEESTRMLIECT